MSITVLSAAQVGERLPSPDRIRGAIADAFRSLGHGSAVQPPQVVARLPGDAGDVILYPAVLGRTIGVKVSPFIASRPTGQQVSAWTLLLSADTGEPVLLCDSKDLTASRTAATTALAVDLLAAPGVQVLTVIGSGPIAATHVDHVRSLRPWTTIRVFSPNLAVDPSRLSRLSADPRVVPFTDVRSAVTGADVVMCCTSAATTVVDADWLNPGTIVTSISTNAADAREVDPAQLHRYDVVCDDRSATPAVAAEMRLAIRDHGWLPTAIVADLAGLLAGATGPSGERPILFRSVGLGIEDIAIADLLRAPGDGPVGSFAAASSGALR